MYISFEMEALSVAEHQIRSFRMLTRNYRISWLMYALAKSSFRLHIQIYSNMWYVSVCVFVLSVHPNGIEAIQTFYFGEKKHIYTTSACVCLKSKSVPIMV